jgi:hypothetical protein
MPTSPHPADSPYRDHDDEAILAFCKEHNILVCASVDEVGDTDLSDQVGGIYVRSLRDFFFLDSEETGPEDDATILVDGEGNFFVIAPKSFIDTDVTLAANSDLKVASQKAIKAYADQLLAANDAMVFKGAIDCSGNPNYPAASAGHTYKISVAGKIGGASGDVVEAGDTIYCIADSTAAGDKATVGAYWVIVQFNLDAASNTVAGKVKVSTSASAATGTATDEALRVADAAANFLGQGLHEIGYWPARALRPSATNGAAALTSTESTTNKLNTEYIGFVNGSTTYAELSFRAPKKLDPSAALYVEFEWMEAGSATAHVCRWQAEAQAQGDGDTIDSSWGTAVAVDDTGSSGTRRFALTGAVTPGGTWAQGDKVVVRLARLGGHANDTLDVDARLIGVTLFASVNLKNDA